MRELRRIILLILACFAIATVWPQGKTNLVQANHVRGVNTLMESVVLEQPSFKSDHLYVFVTSKGPVMVSSPSARFRLVKAEGSSREYYGTITDAVKPVSITVTGTKPTSMEIQVLEVTK